VARVFTQADLDLLRKQGDRTTYDQVDDGVYSPSNDDLGGAINDKDLEVSQFLQDQLLSEREAKQNQDRSTASQPNQVLPSTGGIFSTLKSVLHPKQVQPVPSELLDAVRPAGMQSRVAEAELPPNDDDQDDDSDESQPVMAPRATADTSSPLAAPATQDISDPKKIDLERLKAFIDSQDGFTNRSVDDLAKAQQTRNQIIMANQLSKAGERVAAAFARKAPNYEVADQNIKLADNVVKDYQDRAAFEKVDPNSATSASYRAMIAQVMPKLVENPAFAKASASDLEKLFPALSKLAGPNSSAARGKQIVPIMGPDGKIQQILVDKITGEKTALGDAGFAYGTGTNKYTGENILIPRNGSQSSVSSVGAGGSIRPGSQVPGVMPGRAGNSVPTQSDIPNLHYTDLNPKNREQVDKLQKEFREADTKIQDFEGTIAGLGNLVQKNLDGTIGTIKRQLARTIGGEKGVLTDNDVKDFGGSDRVWLTIAQWAHAKKYGGMTPEIQQNYQAILDVAKQNIQIKRNMMEQQYYSPLRGLLPQANEPAIKEILQGKAAPQGADSMVDTSNGEAESKLAGIMNRNQSVRIKDDARKIQTFLSKNPNVDEKQAINLLRTKGFIH
jgi:hypothetical protein